jgi:transposase, IS5 family
MVQYNGDFFQGRLDTLIDPNHELAILSTRLPWAQLEAAIAPLLQKKQRPIIVASDTRSGLLFEPHGPALPGTAISPAGRPRHAIRLMCSLIFLKHKYNLSDEALCAHWAENIYWQHFSGAEIYSPKPPCDATQIGRFRTAIGELGAEILLKATIDTAIAMGAIKPAEFERVIVDTTVQEKAIAFPTDARLLEIARRKVVNAAQRAGIALRQTFAKEGATLLFKAGGYAHAKQFKRLKKVIKRQKTIVGILVREVQRALARMAIPAGVVGTAAAAMPAPTSAATAAATAMTSAPAPVLSALSIVLERAERIRIQERFDKNKLYAMHAPEVECIGKGKARSKYEFGVKVSLAITHKSGLIVGAKCFPGTPYDGHTLHAQIAQSNALIARCGRVIKQAVVDLGFRGIDVALANPGVNVTHRGRIKSMTKAERKILKRRQAIEPVIGHVKHDHGMLRCHLKGALGDAIHVICCAVGFNIGWLMRAIKRLGLKGLFAFVMQLVWLSKIGQKPMVYLH